MGATDKLAAAVRITAVPRSGHPNSGLQAMRFAEQFGDEVWALPAEGRYIGTYDFVRFSALETFRSKHLFLLRMVRIGFLLSLFLKVHRNRDRLYFVHSLIFAIPLRILQARYCVFIHGSDRRFLKRAFGRWISEGAIDCFGVGFGEEAGRARIREVPNIFTAVEPASSCEIRYDLVFVLRNAPVKNPYYPVHLCDRLGQALSLRVAVAGVAEDELPVGEKIRVSNLRERGVIVDYVGRQSYEEVIALLRASSALMIPSHSEGLPKVLLEAMSQGLEIIANDKLSFPPDLAVRVRHVALADWEAVLDQIAAIRIAGRSGANIEAARAYLQWAERDLRRTYDAIYHSHQLQKAEPS